MKSTKLWLLGLLLALASTAAIAQTYPTCYKTATGWTIGSGCTINVASGGALQIAGVAVTPSAAEINKLKVSTRVVALAVDTTLTEATHEGKMLVMGGAGSSRTFTMPAATGGGAVYTFVVGAVNTSNYVITKAGSDTLNGSLLYASDNASNAALAFEGTGGTITLNGTTKGGASIGDIVVLRDCASAKWCVSGQVTETGSETTPFS